MTSFKEFPINFILVGLFITCMIAGTIALGGNYDKGAEEMFDEGDIPYTAIRSQVNATSNEAERWGESFKGDRPSYSTGVLALLSIWGVMSLIWNSVTLFFNLIFNMFQTYLMIPPVVTGTIIAILVIGLTFAMWRALKTGD